MAPPYAADHMNIADAAGQLTHAMTASVDKLIRSNWRVSFRCCLAQKSAETVPSTTPYKTCIFRVFIG